LVDRGQRIALPETSIRNVRLLSDYFLGDQDTCKMRKAAVTVNALK